MVGAMTPDSGVDYFNRKSNKLVVARGDREDAQIAALNTSVAGLVVTGGVTPGSKVLYFAEEKAVPVLATAQDTLTALDGVEQAVVGAQSKRSADTDKLSGIVANSLDLKTLLEE